MSNVKPIRFPPGANWGCHQTGVCCTHFDTFEVTEEEARTISDRASEIPIETETPVIRDELGARLALVGDRCSFLSRDNLCQLHERFGPEGKPLTCREFPWLFIDGPDAVYVGLSFVCPSAIRNSGAPVSDAEESIREILSRTRHRIALRETLELDEDKPLEWEEYLRIEAGLLNLIEDESIHLDDALIAGSAWIGMLSMFIADAKNAGASCGEAIEHFISSMEQTNQERVLRVAHRSAESPRVQRMFLGMIIAFRNTLSRPRGRAKVVTTILWNYLRHAMRWGQVRIAPLEESIRYADLRAARFDPNAEWAAPLLRRYLRMMIFRKDLIRRTDVKQGYALMLIVFAMTRWYARALASRRGVIEVGEEDLVEAISLTERFYGAHSQFFELFERFPALHGGFESLSRRPNFAHTLVRPGK